MYTVHFAWRFAKMFWVYIYEGILWPLQVCSPVVRSLWELWGKNKEDWLQSITHCKWRAGENPVYTVIRFLWVSAKFGTCTVLSVNGTFAEDNMRRFRGECAHFIFNKCPIYIHDGASTKFSTNSLKTDYSVPTWPLSCPDISCDAYLVAQLSRHQLWCPVCLAFQKRQTGLAPPATTQ